jgi:hypothetical protein
MSYLFEKKGQIDMKSNKNSGKKELTLQYMIKETSKLLTEQKIIITRGNQTYVSGPTYALPRLLFLKF